MESCAFTQLGPSTRLLNMLPTCAILQESIKHPNNIVKVRAIAYWILLGRISPKPTVEIMQTDQQVPQKYFTHHSSFEIPNRSIQLLSFQTKVSPIIRVPMKCTIQKLARISLKRANICFFVLLLMMIMTIFVQSLQMQTIFMMVAIYPTIPANGDLEKVTRRIPETNTRISKQKSKSVKYSVAIWSMNYNFLPTTIFMKTILVPIFITVKAIHVQTRALRMAELSKKVRKSQKRNWKVDRK